MSMQEKLATVVVLAMMATAMGCGGGGGGGGASASASASAPAPTATSEASPTANPNVAQAEPVASKPIEQNPVIPTDTVITPKKWVELSSTTLAYSGSFLATKSFRTLDGTNLYAFGGPEWGGTQFSCNPVPFKAIGVDATGQITDATPVLNQTSIGAIHARQLIVGDFNGDGSQDMYFANHGCDSPPFPGEKNHYFLSSGSGFVDKSATLPPINSFSHSAAVGDLRKSGYQDVLVGVLGMQDNPGLPAMYQGDNTGGTYVGAYILRNDGAGNLTYDNTALPLGLANPSSAPQGTVTTRFTSATFGDLNGDGYPDLVVGADQNAAVAGSVFMNDKVGKFKTAEITLPVGLFGVGNTITVAIAAADLNGDGLPDLLLSQTPNAPKFYDGGKVQVVINKGNGVFEDQTDKYIPNQQKNVGWSQWIHLLDLNGDGRKDILLESDQEAVSDAVAYSAQADGTFKSINRADLPASVRSLHPLDFSGRTLLLSARKRQADAVLKVYEYK
jgi:hypothetical protein